MTVANVTIPANRSIVVFKLNGNIYRMLDVAQGDVITVPVSELASWTIPDGTTINSDYAEFEATVTNTYGVHWVIDGTDTVTTYHVGDTVTPPNADRDGYLFTGWLPSAPAVIPAHDVTCTATYTAHTHQWTETHKSGDCETGITTYYVCVCGEEKSETGAKHSHSFTAVLSDNGSAGNTLEKLVCTECGYSKDQNISFKVTYSQSRKTTVLDLSLYENEVSVTEPTQAVKMRVYIGETGKRYTVTRIDADGTLTAYYVYSTDDGYLKFDANHFSIYVISELDESGTAPAETLSYAESAKLLADAQPIVDDTPLAENRNDNVNNSGNGGGSNNNNSSSSGGTGYYGGGSFGGSSVPAITTKPTEQKPEETPWSNPFADVTETAYYYAAVAWAAQLGITNGTGGNSFSPNKSCSRAEIVTFLWRAKGSPEPTLAQSPFDDLDENAYYYKAALWAYENGVTYGASESGFAPNADCTRAQVVTFLWRAENSPTVSANSDFVDVDGETYYADAVAWAVAQAITNGTGGGAFSPEMACTRAQIVTFLYRDLAEQSVA